MALISEGRVVVTGASRGIGRAVVEALIARGARVAAVGRDRETLAAVAAVAPDRVHVLAVDLSDRQARRRLPAQAQAALGGIDGLVGCAGVARHAALEALTEEDLEATLAVNFVAPLFLTRAVAQLMRSQGGPGSIVHVASTLAYAPAAGTVAYAASKAALVAAVRTLALELAPHRVRVNAVAPGLVDTDMLAGRDRKELAAQHPLGRLGHPAEIAATALHLLDAEWATGSLWPLDGGLTL